MGVWECGSMGVWEYVSVGVKNFVASFVELKQKTDWDAG